MVVLNRFRRRCAGPRVLTRGRAFLGATRLLLALPPLAAAFFAAPEAQAAAAVSREYDLKAVFLYNLVSFVQWPASAFASPDAPLVIGVAGPDPFGTVLDEVVANEYVGKHPILVRRFHRGEDVADCHLVFIAESDPRRVTNLLREMRGKPVLTVGDRPGFLEAGGMIGFATRGDQLQLFVNRDAVQRAELVLSSKLLELAQGVEALTLP